ncbi:MAG TPA: universal stress protein [Archangium sp.]
MAILCATDFSPQARHAEDAAAVLAGRLGQPLWLLHVQEPDLEVLTSPPALLRAALKERLMGIANRLQPLARAQIIDTAVEVGRPVAKVRAFADSRDVSLLVVGTAGHGSQSLVRLGGTSERLASGSELPVLVVREGDTFREWLEGKAFRALLALDEGEASASALRWLTQLREAGPIDVVVGRVYYASDAHHRYGVPDPRRSYTEADRTVESLIERDLKRQVPSLPGQGELFYRAKLGFGRVADHLLELAEAERCQLVVVGTHAHRGIGRMWSVSAATLHLARTAVALVPPDGMGVGNLAPSARLQRLIVPTDLSQAANAAVPWAYRMVERGGEVVLVYLPSEPLALSARAEADLAARLRLLTPASAEERAVLTRTEVVHGADPAKALLTLSEQLASDALVVSGAGKLSAHLVANASRPVMVVPSPVDR